MVDKVKARHILVPTKEEAEDAIKQINDGKGFAQVAEEVSKCPSSKDGGKLGWFGRGEMVPEFDKAAFTLEKDQMSEPIKTQFGWHVILVYDKK